MCRQRTAPESKLSIENEIRFKVAGLVLMAMVVWCIKIWHTFLHVILMAGKNGMVSCTLRWRTV